MNANPIADRRPSWELTDREWIERVLALLRGWGCRGPIVAKHERLLDEKKEAQDALRCA